MFGSSVSVAPLIAQAAPIAKPAATKPAAIKPAVQPVVQPTAEASANAPWLVSGVLLIMMVAAGVFAKLKYDQFTSKLKFEGFKNQELQKKLKLALRTITDMERNPDLIYSREINVDYLRLRMSEDLFNTMVLNQVKVRVKEQLSVALRSQSVGSGVVGIPGNARKVDEIFDVEDLPPAGSKAKGRVLFRIQFKLTKLPTQATSKTIEDVIGCIQNFLAPPANNRWQPTIQGRLAAMHWDQNAKPTPLLVLEQSNEGVNVVYKTKPLRPALS